ILTFRENSNIIRIEKYPADTGCDSRDVVPVLILKRNGGKKCYETKFFRPRRSLGSAVRRWAMNNLSLFVHEEISNGQRVSL
ncbi:MAG: hypothetical protein LUG52_08915, partial [Clostridia bacterium]|nr:hypothetical protein [Clostridia bacterium]